MSSDNEVLVSEALAARAKAHCPYSDFPVGAALKTKSGKIVTGAWMGHVNNKKCINYR